MSTGVGAAFGRPSPAQGPPKGRCVRPRASPMRVMLHVLQSRPAARQAEQAKGDEQSSPIAHRSEDQKHCIVGRSAWFSETRRHSGLHDCEGTNSGGREYTSTRHPSADTAHRSESIDELKRKTAQQPGAGHPRRRTIRAGIGILFRYPVARTPSVSQLGSTTLSELPAPVFTGDQSSISTCGVCRGGAGARPWPSDI